MIGEGRKCRAKYNDALLQKIASATILRYRDVKGGGEDQESVLSWSVVNH